MRSTTAAAALALVFVVTSAAAPVPQPPAPTFEQKMSWILRLEDQRVLRDPLPPPPASAPATGKRKKNKKEIVPPPPPPPPDLVRMLSDNEARIRRRAALAIGRTRLAEGVDPLVGLMKDPDPEVRQMAAFALGLIADARAVAPLTAALGDPAPLMKGSAAEALGLIGDASAASAVARMASQIVASGALASLPPDETDAGRDSPSAAFRLALNALVRLKAYDAVASVVLDAAGQPQVRWWPVAFALQRLEDPRALPALVTLAADSHPYTRAFAAKGLGAMKDRRAVEALVPLVRSADEAVAVEAIRSLGRLRDASATPALLALFNTRPLDPHVRLEAVVALGGAGGPGAVDLLIDLLGDASPSVRAAALRSLAQLDAEGFVTILSGLDLDTHWSVRSALASVLGTLNPEAGLPRLRDMLNDPDARVVPAVLAAIAKLNPSDLASLLLDKLKADDPIIRATAANLLGELKPGDGAAALAEAYTRGVRDTTYTARAAALTAVAAYGRDVAAPVLTSALADPEWAVRVRAASLLKSLDPASDPAPRIRPAIPADPSRYEPPRLVNPPVSIEAFVETDRGTIRIELAVLDAPQAVENFVTLARKGFFDGLPIHRVVPDFVVQAGDPRGDSEGGPGYAIRDELNERPFLRGAVGMALDWEDTGGSQFFITHSPQPHLDARYTVFGRVVAGMDVVDRIEPWDVMRRVKIWDGSVPPSP